MPTALSWRMADSPLAAALEHHRAGRLDLAEAIYRGRLAELPDDAEACHLLGVLLHQRGRSAEGRVLVAHAVAAAPAIAAYRANLGMLELALGDHAAAAAAFLRAAELDPALSGPLRALRAQAHLACGDHAAARAAYDAACADEPDVAAHWRGAALARHALGDAAGALPAYRRAAELDPADMAALNGLGAALLDTGRAAEALVVLERAAAGAATAWGPLLANLGNARRMNGDLAGAVAAIRQAADCDPGNPTTLANLGATLSEAGALCEAAEACRAALRLAPDDRAARANLAACLFDTGDVAGALAHWRADPDDRQAGANALYAMNFVPGLGRTETAAAARDWALRHAPPVPPGHFANDRDPDRRLRVGFVSPDLRSHSVAWFLLPVLEALDPARIEAHAFSELAVEDAISARLRRHFAAWQPTAGSDTAALAAAVRAARIDVLVDLAGHTAGNRLDAFAARAAPVQASWLGYPEITGVAAIDARLTDADIDPAPAPDEAGPERPLRLPRGAHAYRLPDGAPDVAARGDGPPVFGSFNNWPKHAPACLAAWARILTRVPGSRLVLKNKAMADGTVRAQAVDFFVARGIAAERIETLARVSDPRGHLALYGMLDVALDPFPYNGVTTTCEALAMGVPVVALRGATPAGRTAAAFVARIGCPELAADTVDAYVDAAVALVGDRARLAAYRRTLRARLAVSPLGDGPAIAADLTHALRSLWQGWLRENPAG